MSLDWSDPTLQAVLRDADLSITVGLWHPPFDPLTAPCWWQWREPCDCPNTSFGRNPHRWDCALTPIYVQTFADTGQPRYPWTWPWLVTGYPECSCDDEPQFCEIHGEPEWLRRYAARWT